MKVHKLSSGNGQISTIRVKLGNTTIVSNTQTLPNGNLFIGYVDLVVGGNISIDLSQPLEVDFTYQDVAIICVSTLQNNSSVVLVCTRGCMVLVHVT